MFNETIKITVVTNSGKKEKVFVIESDGSYRMVEAKVNAIVNREFPVGTVKKVSWNYV